MREAVELLAGERQALLVTERRARRPGSSRAPTCSSRWRDERALGRASPRARSTPASSPTRTSGSVIPPIHQTSTYVQPAPGEFVEDYDYARSANPTRAALERALGELEGGLATAFSRGMAATHALITAACSAGDHVVLPADLYGGTYRLVDKVLTRWGLTYDDGRPDRPRRGRARRCAPRRG